MPFTAVDLAVVSTSPPSCPCPNSSISQTLPFMDQTNLIGKPQQQWMNTNGLSRQDGMVEWNEENGMGIEVSLSLSGLPVMPRSVAQGRTDLVVAPFLQPSRQCPLPCLGSGKHFLWKCGRGLGHGTSQDCKEQKGSISVPLTSPLQRFCISLSQCLPLPQTCQSPSFLSD